MHAQAPVRVPCKVPGEHILVSRKDSKPEDPLCCNTTRTMQPFLSAGDDFVLVLRLKIRMQACLLVLLLVLISL